MAPVSKKWRAAKKRQSLDWGSDDSGVGFRRCGRGWVTAVWSGAQCWHWNVPRYVIGIGFQPSVVHRSPSGACLMQATSPRMDQYRPVGVSGSAITDRPGQILKKVSQWDKRQTGGRQARKRRASKKGWLLPWLPASFGWRVNGQVAAAELRKSTLDFSAENSGLLTGFF